jgi:chloride channel protein, CIC family
MTGSYGLMLPVMLAVAVATAAARRLSYGTIYTRKLLRRGIDIGMSAASDVTAAPAVPSGGSLVEIRPAEGTSELVSAGASR